MFVKNNKGNSIKVLRFEYTVEGKARTFDESLVNKRLAPGETEIGTRWRCKRRPSAT